VVNDISSVAISVSDVWADLQKVLPCRTATGNLELIVRFRELQCFLGHCLPVLHFERSC
jgi:hypothetical protein